MVSFALLLALVPTLVSGANDWSKPCVSGSCAYHAGDGVTSAYSSLTLHDAGASLSDITSAAGWQISGCSSTWSSGAHAVVLTCSTTGSRSHHCDHVLREGAVGKIVRLPQECGAGPFARVARWTRPSGGNRSAGGAQAHTVVLDYDFKRANSSRGQISFSLTGSNVPTNSTVSPFQVRSRRRRQLVSPRFDKSGSTNAPPISLSKDITLIDKTFSCPANGGIGVDAHLKVDLDVGVDAQVAFGYIVSGSIFPPKLKKLALTSTINGDAFAELNVDASVKGSFDTGSVELLSLGLPGLSVPGIFSLGPQFVVNGQINADLGVQALVKAGIKWTFPTVSLVFPPSQGQSVAQAEAAQTPLDVSINPTAQVNGQLTGHIIPKVLFGINVLDGLAKADVFVDMDVSSTLGLQVTSTGSNTGGCVTLNGAVDIAAGAEGAIKPIFDKSIRFDIFNKQASLFQKCFGTAGTTRRLSGAHALDARTTPRSVVDNVHGVETDRARQMDDGVPQSQTTRRDIICPGPTDNGNLVQVASQ
ncbi:hypothetical protein AURDEDRAFT_152807 [Auricularia subglabra TFB-10046 SS5]|nr:hypothetical protein AURDEDRAFT_152807 [Auricularia subglabra TFB-10046 SS5]